MTIGSDYDDWQAEGARGLGGHCSPNLLAIKAGMLARWPDLTNLGCYGARPIRGGTAPSSHSYGAAIDLGYSPERDQFVADSIIPWLVAWSEELHVSAIHDYRRCRIWHAGRTPQLADGCSLWWKAQRPSSSTGMGQAWANHLHVETSRAGWSDATPVVERFTDG